MSSKNAAHGTTATKKKSKPKKKTCPNYCERVLTSSILPSSVNPPQQNKITASMREGEAFASMVLILSKLSWKNVQVRSCPSLPEEETLQEQSRTR